MTIGTYQNKVKFLIFVIAIACLWFLGRYFNIDVDRLQHSLEKFPFFASGIIFVFLYVTVTFFIWLSKDIFRISAALLFGPGMSTMLVFIAEMINASILFNFSRIMGRGFVEQSLKGRFKDLDSRFTRANFLWLFIFRATPFIPFRFMDLACGLTKISFRRYFLVALLGSPARIFWLQYILASVGKGIFSRPGLTVDYLLSNKFAFISTFVYLILIFVVFFKVKLKE